MNRYLRNLNKVEFVITNACTGRCIHCSQGDHTAPIKHIDPRLAADCVRKIARAYPIRTVMTFGGEPLLYLDAVCAVHRAALEMGVQKRQLITNGYFSKDEGKIRAAACALSEAGVNDILLSVDAFHQETIPLDTVKMFAREIKKTGVYIRLQPAWLISRDNDNPYNRRTQAILDSFCDMDIPTGGGNVIFPEGNAVKHFAEYFTDSVPENPYEENPYDVRCVSFSPNGDVLDKNVYQCDINEILKAYVPKEIG